MARVNFEKINWEDNFILNSISDVSEHEDNSDFQKGMDEIRDWLRSVQVSPNPKSQELASLVSRNKSALRNVSGGDQGIIKTSKRMVPTFSLEDFSKIEFSKSAIQEIYGSSNFDYDILEPDENDKADFNNNENYENDSKIKFKNEEAPTEEIKIKFKKEILSDIESKLIFDKKVRFSHKSKKKENTTIKSVMKHEDLSYSISSLLSQMPLFHQNMFSAFFTVTDGAFDDLYAIGDTTTELVSRDRYQHIIDCFGVNLSEFEIPQAKNQTYTVKFLDREIKKISSSYELPHRVELSFEVDQMAMLVQNFQIMSYGGQGNNSKLTLTPVAENGYYAQQFFPAVFKNRTKDIKLYVLFNGMSNGINKTLNKDGDIINGKNQVIGKPDSYKAFIFENVQFLGITNNLEFNRDSVSTLKLTAAFRFQTLKEFDNNRIN